jgi:hypothetical protein
VVTDPLVEELAEEPVEVAETAPPPPMAPPPALQALADNVDVYCSNYIDAGYTPPELFIQEREEGAKTILATGDIVFLSQGAQDGIAPGQEFSVITPENEVWHPLDGEVYLGISVRQIGRLQVLAVQDRSATAEIMVSCDAIEVGDALVPFEEVPVPLAEPVEFDAFAVQLSGENPGYVVFGREPKLSYGQGDILNIDMGTQDGIEAGRIFTIYREWSGSVAFDSAETYIDARQAHAEELQEEGEEPIFSKTIVGQLVVIGTRETTATGKVMVAVREISIGDKVELQ